MFITCMYNKKILLYNIENGIYIDVQNKKKFNVDSDILNNIYLYTSYNFYENNNIMSLFNKIKLFGVTSVLSHTNYSNSPLNINGYRIQNMINNTIKMNEINSNELNISYILSSLDGRVNETINYNFIRFNYLKFLC